MPSRNFNILLFAILIAWLCHATFRRARTAMVVGDALGLIDQFYVEPVDDRELLIAAMRGMTGALDRHSEFIPIDAYGSLQDSINQEFTGIGILIEQSEPGEPVQIVTPLVGSPARAAGLRPGDEIVEVDGRDVRDWDLVNVSKRLKGLAGSRVSLVVRRDGERVPVTVARSRIEMESVVGEYRDKDDAWMYWLREAPDIAYVRLTGFGEKTVTELESVLNQLDNDFDGLVLDLRGNSGGLLYSAVGVSDMFLDSGRIVSTKMRGGVVEEEFVANRGTLVDPDKPIAVLVDGDSASASEIVAAAIQDHDRGVVVGTRSYGKGTVQNILPLEYGRSALRLTVARYYRPNDKNIHRTDDATEEDDWGVRPDPGFEVKLEPEAVAKLVERWRRSAYPMLAVDPEAEGPEEREEPEEPDEASSPIDDAAVVTDGGRPLLELDAQLRRAVEYLRDAVGETD